MTHRERVKSYHKQNAGESYSAFYTHKRMTAKQKRRARHKSNALWKP